MSKAAKKASGKFDHVLAMHKKWSESAIERIGLLERSLAAQEEQRQLLQNCLAAQLADSEKKEREITALHNTVLDIARTAKLPMSTVHELLAHKGARTCANSFMTVPMGV